jgi:hypothetical protein
MVRPAELAVEPAVELWAQSAARKMTIETMSKTIRTENARKQSHWRVGRFEEAMEPGFSPYKTKMISLLESFW